MLVIEAAAGGFEFDGFPTKLGLKGQLEMLTVGGLIACYWEQKSGVGEFACRTFACLVFLWSFACWVNYLAQITCRHLLVGTNTCRTFTCREMLVDIYLQDISLWDIYL